MSSEIGYPYPRLGFGKRVVWRVGGLTATFAAIVQKSRDSARHSRGSPIQTLIAANDGANSTILGPIRRRCINVVRNMVSLSEIRIWKASLFESRRMGRIFARIPPDGSGHRPPILWDPTQTLIAAKKWPELYHSMPNL